MENKLFAIIADVLEIDPDQISADTILSMIPQWDSLAQMQIIAEIEDAFDIEILIETIPNIKKIQDFIDLIR